METIISSFITAAITLIICLINNSGQRKRSEQQQQESMSLMCYKLDELTKRVDEHNHLVERTYHLEEVSLLHEEKIKVANHRIEDLEKGEQR